MTTFGKVNNGIGEYTFGDGSKRWRVVYKVGPKVHSKGGFKTKGAALHWQRHTLVDVEKGDWVSADRKRVTFGTFAAEGVADADLRPSTRAPYSSILKRDMASFKDTASAASRLRRCASGGPNSRRGRRQPRPAP